MVGFESCFLAWRDFDGSSGGKHAAYWGCKPWSRVLSALRGQRSVVAKVLEPWGLDGKKW